jgi:hypothetical protein
MMKRILKWVAQVVLMILAIPAIPAVGVILFLVWLAGGVVEPIIDWAVRDD